MKVLQKENVIKRNQVEHTKTERNVLEYLRHPFIVTLRYAFQTKTKVTTFISSCRMSYHVMLCYGMSYDSISVDMLMNRCM